MTLIFNVARLKCALLKRYSNGRVKKYYTLQNLCIRKRSGCPNFSSDTSTRVIFIKFWLNINVYTVKPLHLYILQRINLVFFPSLFFSLSLSPFSSSLKYYQLLVRGIEIRKIKYFQTYYMSKIAILVYRKILCNIRNVNILFSKSHIREDTRYIHHYTHLFIHPKCIFLELFIYLRKRYIFGG